MYFTRYVLDEYANARRQIVAEAFLNALTVGWGMGGATLSPSNKPIELQSHDPTRYTGDMLAWLHQTSASEKEYIRSLTSEKGLAFFWGCHLFYSLADKELIQDCLNNITNGLAYPLQVRLEQLLVTEHNAVLLYKINNLLQFYSSVIMNLLGAKCTLYTTLSELQSLSWNLFVSALQKQTNELLAEVSFEYWFYHVMLPAARLYVCTSHVRIFMLFN